MSSLKAGMELEADIVVNDLGVIHTVNVVVMFVFHDSLIDECAVGFGGNFLTEEWFVERMTCPSLVMTVSISSVSTPSSRAFNMAMTLFSGISPRQPR